MVPAPFIGGTASVIRSPTATPSAHTGAARNPKQIQETWIRVSPARKTVPLRLDNRDRCPAPRRSLATPGSPRTKGTYSATQCAYQLGVPRGPDLFRQWLTDGQRNGQDQAKAVTAARAGGTPVVTKPDRFALPLHRGHDESIPGVSAAGDDHEDLIPKSLQVMQFQALPAMKE
jgi:hypothetical protein